MKIKMKSNKFWIKTRVFLSFGIFVIIFINTAVFLLYSFIEQSFIWNIEENINKKYTEIKTQISNSDSKIINFKKTTLEELEDENIFFHIWKNEPDIEENYKKWTYIYNDELLIFRWDFKWFNIILWKDISDFEYFKKNLIETSFLLNIFAIIIVFIMSYFVANRVLKPLIKLSKYVWKYNIEKNDNLIENRYGNSEIWIITEEINKLILKSKNTLESQKKFIEDSSHELKTPLMQIETNIDILEAKISDKKQLEKLENIRKSVENMNNIISDLSFVLRWEDKILKTENINMYSYLKNLTKDFNEEAQKKDLKIIISEKEKLELKNSTYYLDRLFWNLIQNSIFYNKWKWKIKIEIFKNKVILQDNWIWVEKEELKKIFSRFYRNNKSWLYNKNWSWLGLTIVKKICDNFSWKIKIESKKWIWSKFEISF